MIKGATALLARKVSVRHTIDIDVYHAGTIADVERQVREAAALDIRARRCPDPRFVACVDAESKGLSGVPFPERQHSGRRDHADGDSYRAW